jgi:hypothetical protein
MTAPATPHLKPGCVYRTQALAKFSANPTRLAKRLVRDQKLVPLGKGLFAHPVKGRFGAVPPDDDELMRGFLDGAPYVFTGSELWNALGLGATAMFAMRLVYNTKRSGVFELGGRRFLLRRVAFPSNPSKEWFVVDLFENAEKAGVSRAELSRALARALNEGTFERERLRQMAERFGTKRTLSAVDEVLEAAG